jgi:hypothetical protein
MMSQCIDGGLYCDLSGDAHLSTLTCSLPEPLGCGDDLADSTRFLYLATHGGEGLMPPLRLIIPLFKSSALLLRWEGAVGRSGLGVKNA